jgi:hypothetical protein
MIRPVPSTVIPVLLSPALVAFFLVHAVVRVGLHLLSLPAPLPQSLAILPAAISLGRYPGVGKKKSAALWVGTPDLRAHGSSPGESHDHSADTYIRGRTRIRSKEDESSNLQGRRGKNIQGGAFWAANHEYFLTGHFWILLHRRQ